MSRNRKDSPQKMIGATAPERRWLDVMLEGQNTRDPSLRIASERRRDRRNAKRLQARRRATRRGATGD